MDRRRGWERNFRLYDAFIDESDLISDVVFPRLVEAVGLCSPVLDFGGGSGKLTSLLPPGSEVTLYDPAAAAIAFAERRGYCAPPMRNCTADRAHLLGERFVHAIMCFVLMSIDSVDGERAAIATVRDALRKGACLDVVITDPRARSQSFSSFETDFARGRHFQYEAVDIPFSVFLKDRKGADMLEVQNFHRPLAVTLASIRNAGFDILRTEPIADYCKAGGANISANPYLFIRAVRS